MPGVVHVLNPYHGIQRGWETTADALARIEETIQLEGADRIAAFFLEPVTGTNGVLVPPDGFIRGIRELCTKYGILMVADEVMSGFGRTGPYAKIKGYEAVVMAKIGAYAQFTDMVARDGPGFATVPYCTISAAFLGIGGALAANVRA